MPPLPGERPALQERRQPLATDAVHDIPDLLQRFFNSTIIDLGFLPPSCLSDIALYDIILIDPHLLTVASQYIGGLPPSVSGQFGEFIQDDALFLLPRFLITGCHYCRCLFLLCHR